MKLLHSADWQMGMVARHVGAAGERVRDERLAAARRVIDVASERGVDLIVLAGDTFESNAVDPVLVRRVGEILGGAPCPVYVLPGNHDPIESGSVWTHDVWSGLDNVHLLLDDEPVDVPGGRLYPAPIAEKRSALDPSTRIDATADDGICIGVTHGSLAELLDLNDDDHPIGVGAAARAGVDYLAIGHWHSTSDLDFIVRQRVAYPGTHEQTKFGERDSGNVLVVTIGSAGSVPEVEQVPTGGLQWLQVRGDDARITGRGELRRLVDRIFDELVVDPARALIDVELTGVMFPDEVGELDRLHEIVAARDVPYANIDHSRLAPPPDDDAWLDSLDGVVREAAMRLRDRAVGQPVEGEVGTVAPEVARQALLELFQMRTEVQA